jgi:hypothetical protein
MKRLLPVLALACAAVAVSGAAAPGALEPGTRVLLDAHNSYPYDGQWANRIDRAIATGLPVAIEQDLVWYTDPATGVPRSILAHGKPFTGTEPSMREYFFERVRPLVEDAIRRGNKDEWPILTLNLDFKTDEPAHHEAVWNLLGEYESWLCTAPWSADGSVQPMTLAPILVLTGEQDEQEVDFNDRLARNGRLRLFGAVHAPEPGHPNDRTNYRRWWNNPWKVIEPEGQNNAGDWSDADQQRLEAAVKAAHDRGLWIRFYTLNGYDPSLAVSGVTASYNFGSEDAARVRWDAVIKAGVDFVATDQYEFFARELHAKTRR